MPAAPIIEKYLKKHPAAAEYRFLFECCRAAFAGAAVRYPDGIRAEVFLETVQRHKLVPHLYPVLKNHCGNVPDTVLRRFQQLFRTHHLHVLKLSGELVGISKLFAANNIPWLSIKGPALSVQLYGDMAMRQSGDLDILVDKKDLDRVIEIIMQAGFVPVVDHARFTEKQVVFIRKYYKDVVFKHPSSNVTVELHWLIDNDRKILLNKGFFNANNICLIPIGNHKIPTFSDEFNRLYLCMHGSHHAWYRLFWLWDVATIIKNMTPEQAGQFIEQAKNYKLKPALGQAVNLIEHVFSIKLPTVLTQIPAPKSMTQLSGKFIFTRDMLIQKKISLHRIYYKMLTLPVKFFISYYYRRIITYVLRKYKRTG
jgi:hypothetical protein